MIPTLLRGSLRRRPAQLGLIFAAVLTAAAAAAVLGAFSARSSARFAQDLRGFGPNLLVRPQVGGPRTLAFEEAERIAAVPFVLAVAPILESDESGRLEVTATSALLALHPSWRLVGSWPVGGEVALGSEADAALAGTAAVSGRVETGDRYDRAVFRPLLALTAAGSAGPGLSRVEVRAAPEHLSAVVERIGATVAGAEALPLVRVSEAEAALTRRLRLLLGTLGVLSLILALLAVAGASAALMGERRAEIGLMLALGYTPHRIAAAQASELAAVGATAALLGAALGEWAARGLAGRVLGSAPAAAGLSWTAGGMGAAGLAAALVVGAGALVIVYRLSRLDAGDLLRGD